MAAALKQCVVSSVWCAFVLANLGCEGFGGLDLGFWSSGWGLKLIFHVPVLRHPALQTYVSQPEL